METIMDKETIMVDYIREAHEKGAFIEGRYRIP